MKFNPRRHFYAAVRAHSLLGQALKAAIDALHPSEDERDAAEAPPQVIVVPAAQVQTAPGVPAEPVEAGTIIIVQKPGEAIS